VKKKGGGKREGIKPHTILGKENPERGILEREKARGFTPKVSEIKEGKPPKGLCLKGRPKAVPQPNQRFATQRPRDLPPKC